jgi:hypothetical protein
MVKHSRSDTPREVQEEWESYCQGSHNYRHGQPGAEQNVLAGQLRELIAADLKVWLEAERRRDWAPLNMAP